jgi:hypothetical protein
MQQQRRNADSEKFSRSIPKTRKDAPASFFMGFFVDSNSTADPQGQASRFDKGLQIQK